MDLSKVKDVSILTDVDSILTVQNLSAAISRGIGLESDMHEEATRMAQHMLNFFGYNDRIIDNILQPEDRDIFYLLEDTGLLATETEETTLFDGREWRINYWRFRKDRIMDLLKEKKKEEGKKEEEQDPDIYSSLPEDIWYRSG